MRDEGPEQRGRRPGRGRRAQRPPDDDPGEREEAPRSDRPSGGIPPATAAGAAGSPGDWLSEVGDPLEPGTRSQRARELRTRAARERADRGRAERTSRGRGPDPPDGDDRDWGFDAPTPPPAETQRRKSRYDRSPAPPPGERAGPDDPGRPRADDRPERREPPRSPEPADESPRHRRRAESDQPPRRRAAGAPAEEFPAIPMAPYPDDELDDTGAALPPRSPAGQRRTAQRSPGGRGPRADRTDDDPNRADRPRRSAPRGQVRPRVAQPLEPDAPPSSTGRRLAANTLIFSVATGLSRIAGLVREIAAAGVYGVAGPISAFTLAFQIPNLVRSLVADAALSAAFVPIFTELLEQRRKQEAFRLAGALFGFILVVLSVITLLFIVLAPLIVPLFTGKEFDQRLDDLTVGLSQVLFPILVLLGLNGLVVGILNAYDHFTIPAIAPLVWNVVIIVLMVVLETFLHGDDKIYAYAIGVLAGTAVQFAMALPVLRQIGFPLSISLNWDPRIAEVLKLMLPVTIGLGIINFDLLVNSILGTLVSEQAPRAIDAAFRVYMLPQGMFSVAVATVLFPALSRLAARRDLDGLRSIAGTGLRQIFLLLIPAAAATIALAEPITRLVYQRGPFTAEDTELVGKALFWFSFSLPFAGVNLLLTRTFFSLRRPWLPTNVALASLAVNGAVSLALYRPLGIAGVVIGTAAGSVVMMLVQILLLSRELGGLEEERTLIAAAIMALAAAALGCVSWLVWAIVDELLGRSLIAQVLSVGLGLSAGTAVYVVATLWIQLPEAHQIYRMIESRLFPRTAATPS